MFTHFGPYLMNGKCGNKAHLCLVKGLSYIWRFRSISCCPPVMQIFPLRMTPSHFMEWFISSFIGRHDWIYENLIRFSPDLMHATLTCLHRDNLGPLFSLEWITPLLWIISPALSWQHWQVPFRGMNSSKPSAGGSKWISKIKRKGHLDEAMRKVVHKVSMINRMWVFTIFWSQFQRQWRNTKKERCPLQWHRNDEEYTYFSSFWTIFFLCTRM